MLCLMMPYYTIGIASQAFFLILINFALSEQISKRMQDGESLAYFYLQVQQLIQNRLQYLTGAVSLCRESTPSTHFFPSAPKNDQLSFLQSGAWKHQGIEQFIEGDIDQ